MYRKLALFLCFAMLAVMTGATNATARFASPEEQAATEAPLAPLGTAFTYQGYLTEDGSPASGNFDFRFILYDASAGGSQVGATLNLDDRAVDQGYFTVTLDFGASAFNGQSRWLEVGVRPGDSSGEYTTLSPRQALTTAPYAAYSLHAPWSGLGGVPAGFADGVDDTWTAHDHLGETWTGSDNPLVITGTFGAPEYAALVLSNLSQSGLLIPTAGVDGVQILSAGMDGVYVSSAGDDGVEVSSAGDDGFAVRTVGAPSTSTTSDDPNGFQVNGAQGNGLFVGHSDEAGVVVHTAGAPAEVNPPDTAIGDSWQKNGFQVNGAENFGLYVGYAWDGVYVYSADYDGVTVYSAGADGVAVHSAYADGLYVYSAGDDGVNVNSAGDNGVYVRSADYNGVYVESADRDGFNVNHAGIPPGLFVSDLNNGVEVNGAEGFGVTVGETGSYGYHLHHARANGLHVNQADDNGVFVYNATNYEGYFNGDIYVSGGCAGCALTTFGVNVSGQALQPGDVVALRGALPGLTDQAEPLLQVALAGEGQPLAGVVVGWAELVQDQLQDPEITIPILAPREGPAEPGEYVTVLIYGLAQVRADATAGLIQTGNRLSISSSGLARPLQTVQVEGIQLQESAPVLGTAIDQPDAEGRVWVLVNPQ